MTYRRDSFAGLSDFGPYALREFEKLEIEIEDLRATVDVLSRLAELNGVVLLYQFNNTLNTIVDPGAGYVAINAVTSQAATEVSLSKIDSYSRRVIGESALDVGAIITLASADLTGSAVYSISSTPMQQTDWFRFGVTYLGGQNFNAVQDEYVRVSWRPPNLTG